MPLLYRIELGEHKAPGAYPARVRLPPQCQTLFGHGRGRPAVF